jgi:hypothetical protein
VLVWVVERKEDKKTEVILRHDSLLGVRTWKEKDQEIVRNLQRKRKNNGRRRRKTRSG